MLAEEAKRPLPNAKEKVLAKIARYQEEIKVNDYWGPAEKSELLRFLGLQASSWGSLTGSASMKREKERILLATWRKFTDGIRVPWILGRKRGRKGTTKKETKTEDASKVILETGSTTTITGPSDAKNGYETPIDAQEPISRTAIHNSEPESSGSKTEKSTKGTEKEAQQS